MKRVMLIILILVSAFYLGAENRFFIGASGGYGGFSDHSGKAAFEIGAGYSFSKSLVLLINTGYLSTDTDGKEEDFSTGKVSSVPVELSLKFRLSSSGKLIPWVSAGAGYYINSFSIESGMSSSYEKLGIKVSEEPDNSIGLLFGAGLDYMLGKSVYAGLSAKYVIAKTSADWSFRETGAGVERRGDFNSTLNQLRVMMGIGFYL